MNQLYERKNDRTQWMVTALLGVTTALMVLGGGNILASIASIKVKLDSVAEDVAYLKGLTKGEEENQTPTKEANVFHEGQK